MIRFLICFDIMKVFNKCRLVNLVINTTHTCQKLAWEIVNTPIRPLLCRRLDEHRRQEVGSLIDHMNLRSRSPPILKAALMFERGISICSSVVCRFALSEMLKLSRGVVCFVYGAVCLVLLENREQCTADGMYIGIKAPCLRNCCSECCISMITLSFPKN